MQRDIERSTTRKSDTQITTKPTLFEEGGVKKIRMNCHTCGKPYVILLDVLFEAIRTDIPCKPHHVCEIPQHADFMN